MEELNQTPKTYKVTSVSDSQIVGNNHIPKRRYLVGLEGQEEVFIYDVYAVSGDYLTTGDTIVCNIEDNILKDVVIVP